MGIINSNLTRIGVFYDGNYFAHVSNYYYFHHDRRARISIGGLHNFIRYTVATAMGVETRNCQVVDSHYFRGRLKAADAEQRDTLYRDRVFDDILTREGVVAHYLPLSNGGEKGIDVWLALEAFELAMFKRFDIVVLVAGDGDFLPLVRKLNTLGTRVALLGWDFACTDKNGTEKETRTAQSLLDEVSYPLMMQQVIDDRSRKDDPIINGLFIPKDLGSPTKPKQSVKAIQNVAPNQTVQEQEPSQGEEFVGTIKQLKAGFGFISTDGGTDYFFYHQDVIGDTFNQLKLGDRVKFAMGENEKGVCARKVAVV